MSRKSNGLKKRQIIFSLLFVLLVLITSFFYLRKVESPELSWQRKNIVVANKTLDVYVADTADKQYHGLAGFESLPDEEGMLFVFNSAAPRSFWMKDMRMPIDIIWIKEGKVTGIVENIPVEHGVTDNHLRLYKSNGDADQVLEVRAGWAREYGISVGNEVK